MQAMGVGAVMRWVMIIALGACSSAPETTPVSKTAAAVAPAPKAVRFSADPGPHIRIEPISEHVWLHESSHEVEGYGRVSANGIIVVGSKGAAVVDSSWTPEQTRWLLDRVREATGRPALALIATHSHNDRAGGIGVAAAAGVPSFALDKTNAILRRDNKPAAANTFTTSRSFDLGGVTLEAFYPGAGHTVDNIVVYVGADRLVFGGCLIRSARSKRLGYTKEADIGAWPKTMARVIARYPKVGIVVPGHGPRGGAELLTHTVELAKRGR